MLAQVSTRLFFYFKEKRAENRQSKMDLSRTANGITNKLPKTKKKSPEIPDPPERQVSSNALKCNFLI